MADSTIPLDIISGIKDGMEDLGWGLKLKIITRGGIDPSNPGAGPTETIDLVDFDGLVFDFDEKWMPGSTIEEGDQMVLITVDKLTEDNLKGIKPGNYIIDGTQIYSIIKSKPIKVAGKVVVAIAQVKS